MIELVCGDRFPVVRSLWLGKSYGLATTRSSVEKNVVECLQFGHICMRSRDGRYTCYEPCRHKHPTCFGYFFRVESVWHEGKAGLLQEIALKATSIKVSPPQNRNFDRSVKAGSLANLLAGVLAKWRKLWLYDSSGCIYADLQSLPILM